MLDRIALPAGSQPEPVLVLGSVAFDTIETPFDKGERILGDSASYCALAASYYAPARLVGIVGRDFGEEHINRLKAREIDLEGLQIDQSGDTFFWAGRYHENFNRRDTLETQLNVFETFEPNLPEAYRNTPYVLLGNIGPNLQLHVLEQLQSPKFVVADTMNLWIDIMKDPLLELLPKVDVLILNDDESEQLTGEQNVIKSGKQLKSMGSKSVIVKKGSHGAVLFHDDGLFSIPAYPVEDLRDPTGAGDSFAGAFTAYLAATQKTDFASLKKAMLYGTVTASYTVEAFSCNSLEAVGVTGLEGRYEDLVKLISL